MMATTSMWRFGVFVDLGDLAQALLELIDDLLIDGHGHGDGTRGAAVTAGAGERMATTATRRSS